MDSVPDGKRSTAADHIRSIECSHLSYSHVKEKTEYCPDFAPKQFRL